ncbi:RNA polymerase II transcription factor [Cryptococcus neoformans A2-102-5]|nr:RNA polymerase II transcription factor [Cryptococcus neoformans var. grubii D17-1]OXG93379.1 RNA polymerase II transcription factor [Cryptococcus neoformans var. grubii A2-102-5]
MALSLKDMRPLVVHCDTDYIRAGFAVGELFPRPSVILRACYAIPIASSSKTADANGDTRVADGDVDAPSKSGWLVGDELTGAQKENNWESNLELRWPFRPSKVVDDWEGREYIMSHLLALLGINIQTNSSPLLLIPPPSPPTFTLSTQALYTQFAFESLNTPMFSILPAPLSGLYALGATTGIMIYIGHEESSAFVITDSIVRWECSTSVQIGQADCESHFEQLLLEDDLLDQELKTATGNESLGQEEKRKLVKEVANFVWTECTGDDIEVPALNAKAAIVIGAAQTSGEEDTFDVAKKLVGDPTPAPTNNSHKSKKQQAQALAAANKAAAQAAADAAAQAALPPPVDAIVVTVPSLPEKEIQLGPVRHRICEPLFNGKSVGGDTLYEAVGRAVENASLSTGEKLAVWEGVGVIGEVAKIKSFSPALVTYLSPYLLSSSELPSDCQPSKMRLLSIPDYFANFKKTTTELAPFLGGTLVAKVAFTDSTGKHSVSKVDYNTKGPEAIYVVTGEDR